MMTMEKIMSTASTDPRGESKDLGGKYLTFFLDEEEFGIPILTVKEIIGLLPVTPIPQAPHFVRGVVNLRGSVIPVVELRKKFQMEAIQDTDESCIIVVQAHGVQLGMVVDRVSEVMDMPSQDVVEAPTLGSEINTEYLLGIGKREERVTLLLDLLEIFPPSDLDSLGMAA